MINYSFIIPHKNCPGLLQRCVDSIPERDDVQIIVVDDNSDEGNKPSLKEHKNLQVILLDAQDSKGAGRARNVGLTKATGKWLLFADCDDYYYHNFLFHLDQYTLSTVDVVYFNFNYIDGITGETIESFPFKKYIDDFDGTEISKELIKYRIKVPWCKMVSREFVNMNSIMFEESINGNDILFSLLVGYHAKTIDVIKEPLYNYLRYTRSLSNKISPMSQVCRVEHMVKLNCFYSHIGHPEWRSPLLKSIVDNVKVGGVPFLKVLLKQLPKIRNNSAEWVGLLR